MTPIPLDQIGWRDHKAALWWLGLLYRHPVIFVKSAKKLPKTESLFRSLELYFHALVYIILISVVCRFLIFSLFEVSPNVSLPNLVVAIKLHADQIIAGIAFGIVFGIVFGIAVGIVWGFVFGTSIGTVWAISLGIAGGIAQGCIHESINGVVSGICSGIALGISGEITSLITVRATTGIFVGIAAIVALGAAIELTDGIAMENSLGVGFLISFVVAFGLAVTRLYYHLIFWWLAWPKPSAELYRFHPVAWDSFCRIPFPSFSQLLVAYSEYSPPAGEKEIERIIDDYPSHKKAALRAKTILLARQSRVVSELSQLENILIRLPKGDKGYLAQTEFLYNTVHELCQLQARLSAVSRPILREPMAQLLCQRIENFRHIIRSSYEPIASEFRAAASHWLQLATVQLRQAQAIANKEPNPQVFRAGDPVNREQEAFVPRYGVVGDLEKQIMLATGCPGLVLYGRRRMGKSTILNNLNGFLPDTVVPVFVSMQDPEAFTSLTDWMNHLLQKLSATVALPSAITNTVNDLTGFMRVLAAYNAHLQETGKRVLLALDEYENLDRKIGEKVFPEDLLATIRESIQTHRNITWIFAGSHEITELKHAEWPSYLVSARTIEVPMFTMAETRLLLTEPLKFSPLFKDESKRPRFEPGFWGENGIERIQAQAGGWPHLVQLIAETIVDVINDADQRQVDDTLFEAALNKAIVSGHNVLYQLLRGECTLPGEWEYLSAFRNRETQPLPSEEALYVSLRRRLLMEEANGEWRLRVPLMARWLKQRG